MPNISKYKVMGSIAGLGGSCYGTYEIYNSFCGKPSNASLNSSGESKTPVMEEIKQIINPTPEKPELMSKEEKREEEEVPAREEKQIEQVVKENPPVVDVQPVLEVPVQEKENQQPMVVESAVDSEDVAEEEDEEFIEEITEVQVQKNYSPQSDNFSAGSTSIGDSGGSGTRTYSFYGRDGSIKISRKFQQFKDYLITSVNEEGIWNEKVNQWKTDLDNNKQRGHQPQSVAEEFVVDMTKNKYKDNVTKELQKRCFTAYNKNDWVNPNNRRHESKIKKYWEYVWKYCGQPTKQMPSAWYRGSR